MQGDQARSLTPSLPQPVNFQAEISEKHTDMPASNIYFGPITHALSMLCILMKILSHARKTKRAWEFDILHFWGHFQVTSSWHGSEGVNIMAEKGLTSWQ